MNTIAVLLLLKIISAPFTSSAVSTRPNNNGEDIHGPNKWGFIDIDNAVVILNTNLNHTLSALSDSNSTVREMKRIYISVDFSWPKRTVDHIIHTITQIAHQNKYHDTSIELWLSLVTTSNIINNLEIAINVTRIANQISNRTITTVLLDYGMLQLTTTSTPIVKDDLAFCSRKTVGLNIRCGILTDSHNCLISSSHIAGLGMKPGQIFSLNDYGIMSMHAHTWSSMIYPCIWILKASNVFVGSKMFYNYNITLEENYDDINIFSMDIKSFLNGWTNYKDEYDLRLDYVIADPTQEISLDNITKFNALTNEEEWFHKPMEFDRNHFGISLYTRHTFIFDNNSMVVSLLQQFSRILIEVDDIKGGTDFVSKLAHAAKQNSESACELGLVMNIKTDDFELNREDLNRYLSIAAAGNEVFSGCVGLILFNWAIPLQEDETSSSAEYDDDYDNDVYLNQAKALHQILKYVEAQNITDVRFGVFSDLEQFSELLLSHEPPETFHEISKLSLHHVNTVVCSIVIPVDGLSWDKLLMTSRTFIYLLTAQIGLLREFSSETLFPTNVGVYIGIDGCTGTQLETEVTEYLLFWEIIHTWAVTQNVSVFINTAYETERTEEERDGCEEEYLDTGRRSCMCGLWRVSYKNNLLTNKGSIGEAVATDKKSIARRLFAQKQPNAPKNEEQSNHPGNYKWHIPLQIALVTTGVLVFAALLGTFTFYMVQRYRSKDLISRREVQDFMLGNRRNTEEVVAEGSVTAYTAGYNKDLFEVPASSYSIDFDCHLGTGEFGTVYKGTIERRGVRVDVAVKMRSNRLSADTQRHADILALRGIISEIKILSYVGDHPNIVRMEGAYTAKLRRGTAIVFLELCPMGSLDKHLRTYNIENCETSQQENIVETSFIGNANLNLGNDNNSTSGEQTLPTELRNNLTKWSQEIANGMEFLTSKKLVHADLATRNVLLDAHLTAKISDFGLSRRLYNYTEYIKQEAASLPWRWMAPEALRKLTFNEKTDVWAYGVTLWEMYTLGDLPYPGLSYHINFAALLSTPTVIGGVRLAKPKYSSKRTYQIMQQCWEIYPGDRPTFGNLQAMLRSEN